jgi:hypothetical protein
MAPPPVRQALVLSFQVSEPGSPGAGNHEGLPLRIAGPGIERGDPVAHAVVPARGADDDGVLQGKGRRRDLKIRLIEQVLVPRDPAGLLVGSDHPPVEAGDRDDVVTPQRDAAVAVGLARAGVHLPHHPTSGAGAHVDLVDHAPHVGGVEKAVFDDGRRFVVFIAAGAAERHRKGESEVLRIGGIDGVERGEPVRAIVVVVHEPVAGLWMGKPLERHLGRGGGRDAEGQAECSTDTG